MLLICPALLIACSEPEFNIPDRNSIGVSRPLIEIYAPAGGSVLPADTPFTLDYAILRSSGGHHVKIRIDDDEPQIVMRLKGKHQIRGLPAGTHRVRITEYTKHGVETGGDITLSITMRTASKQPKNMDFK